MQQTVGVGMRQSIDSSSADAPDHPVEAGALRAGYALGLPKDGASGAPHRMKLGNSMLL